jgi:hypothetical protein
MLLSRCMEYPQVLLFSEILLVKVKAEQTKERHKGDIQTAGRELLRTK